MRIVVVCFSKIKGVANRNRPLLGPILFRSEVLVSYSE